MNLAAQINNTLESKTLVIWHVGLAVNGRHPNRVTVSDVNKALRELTYVLGPHRKSLLGQLNTLQEQIIYGTKRPEHSQANGANGALGASRGESKVLTLHKGS
jgi:hypothetical protein